MNNNAFASAKNNQYFDHHHICMYVRIKYSRGAALLEGMRDILITLGYADQVVEIDAYVSTLIMK